MVVGRACHDHIYLKAMGHVTMRKQPVKAGHLHDEGALVLPCREYLVPYPFPRPFLDPFPCHDH